MMPELAGLWQAVRESPHDDAPRLILADWLEDHGDADWAELIRTQVGRAAREGEPLRRYYRLAYDPEPDDESRFVREACGAGGALPVSIDPDAREAELADALRGRWGLDLPGPLEFDRGLPERVQVTAYDYLARADAYARLSPVLSVGLTGYAEGDGFDDYEAVDRLARHPSLANWVELNFMLCPGDEVFSRVLSSPHLTDLRRLIARENEAGPVVGMVADDEKFSELRWLDVWESDSELDRPGDRALADIANCPHLSKLEHLDYGSCAAGDAGLAALASSPAMSRLRSLALDSNYTSADGWRALARSTTLSALRHLELSNSQSPGDAGLADLLAWPLLPRLHYLSLASCGLTDAGVERLAASPGVAGVASLELGGSRYVPGGAWRPELTGATARLLAASPHLTGLRRLALWGTPLTDDEALALARLPALERLWIDAKSLTDGAKGALRGRFGDGLAMV